MTATPVLIRFVGFLCSFISSGPLFSAFFFCSSVRANPFGSAEVVDRCIPWGRGRLDHVHAGIGA